MHRVEPKLFHADQLLFKLIILIKNVVTALFHLFRLLLH